MQLAKKCNQAELFFKIVSTGVNSCKIVRLEAKINVDKYILSNKITGKGGGLSMKLMNKKGVTLIELVVVFVIIAIGAALLAPNVGAWLPNYRLRSAARDITSAMRTAQLKAVSTNMEYRVRFLDSRSYVLERNTGGFIQEGATQTIPAGISLDLSKLPGSEAHFNTNSTCSIGSVTLTNTKGSQKTITLNSATGRVKLE